ncbi:MAG: exodeoxyribonuclease VII small subunit [Lachnospiraceae bacterium]|nr:exodeoxyribonuclease VII small subunit [Lachnospiraceae bacterium]
MNTDELNENTAVNSGNSEDNGNSGSGRTLEETLAALEEVLAVLEDPTTPLEASFEAYRKGMKLLKECEERIDLVEKKVIMLGEEGESGEL